MKRTPKNYQGTKFPIKKISPLLEEFLVKISPKKTLEKEAIFNAWYAIIGEKMAPMTKPISFQKGTLTVLIKTHSLYSFLCTHEKARILQEIRSFSNNKIKQVQFRIG